MHRQFFVSHSPILWCLRQSLGGDIAASHPGREPRSSASFWEVFFAASRKHAWVTPALGFLTGLRPPQALIFSSAYFDQRPSGRHSLEFLSASPFPHLLVCSLCLWDSTHMAPLPLARFFPATSLLNLGQPGVARVSRDLRAEPTCECTLQCSNHF